MDSLSDIGITDDVFDTSWLDDTIPDMPKLTPEEQAETWRFVALAAMRKNAEPKPPRKREDPDTGPSKKISIRVLRPILDLLKEQAAARGMGYQTYMNMMLHDAALKAHTQSLA
jgi:predicted DNA binding CopG/RHH family protein